MTRYGEACFDDCAKQSGSSYFSCYKAEMSKWNGNIYKGKFLKPLGK